MHINMKVTSADPRREEIGRIAAEAIRQRYGTLKFQLDVNVVGLMGEDRGAARYTGAVK